MREEIVYDVMKRSERYTRRKSYANCLMVFVPLALVMFWIGFTIGRAVG